MVGAVAAAVAAALATHNMCGVPCVTLLDAMAQRVERVWIFIFEMGVFGVPQERFTLRFIREFACRSLGSHKLT